MLMTRRSQRELERSLDELEKSADDSLQDLMFESLQRHYRDDMEPLGEDFQRRWDRALEERNTNS
jgi:hypothetical protein